MREDWEVKKLGDVCNYLTDGDWIENKDQSLSGIRLIQTGNIGKGYFKDKSDSYKFISESTFYDLDCKEVFPGDILVSRLPDPIGRACIVPQLNGKLITAVDCTIIRIKELLLSQFFIYYTMSNVYYSRIKNFITGAVRKRISRSNLSRIEIPIPPLQTQHQIVEELDCLTSIIEKQKKQLEELDNLAQAIFYDMFGDPIENEKGWDKSSFGREFKISSGGTPDTRNQNYWDNGTISWIGSNLCHNSILYKNDGKYITDEGLLNSSAKIYNSGYVLVALVGATIGKVAMLKFSTTTNQNIAGIDVNDNPKYTSEFIFFTLKSLYPLFLQLGGDKFKMANLSFVRALPLISPPLPLQQQFASKIEAIEKQKELIKKSIKETEVLFNSRMDYYFN